MGDEPRRNQEAGNRRPRSRATTDWRGTRATRGSVRATSRCPPARANRAAPSGNVAYAATRPSELAEASWSDSTRLGTDASFAGLHMSVSISIRNEITTSSTRSWKNGNSASRTARPMSHVTITLRRSHRSISAPPTGASTKPGSIRAIITRPIPVPPDTDWARARMASSPIQSPRLEENCAANSRKNGPLRTPKVDDSIGCWSDPAG